MVKASINIDQQRFSKVLAKYMQVSKKTFADECNKRAFNIALNASSGRKKFTKAASFSSIQKELKKGAKVQPPPRKRRKKKGTGPRTRRKKAPLAAILINYARGKRGEKGLTGEAMQAQVDINLKSKNRGIGFMRAGWLGAADDIRPYLKKSRPRPKNSSGFRLLGKGKHARSSLMISPEARVTHGVPWSDKVPAARIGLKKAVRAETRDMLVYLKRKMRQDWKGTKKR